MMLPADSRRVALVTAFEPWGEHVSNSSWEAVRLVGGQEHIQVARLAVDHESAARGLTALLQETRPVACLCCGMAAGTPRPRLERWARRPPSAAADGGPAVLETDWPLLEAHRAFATVGLKLVSSDDAGGFVCETTLWALLDFQRRNGWPHWAGFLHVPSAGPDCPSEAVAAAIGLMVDLRLTGALAAGDR